MDQLGLLSVSDLGHAYSVILPSVPYSVILPLCSAIFSAQTAAVLNILFHVKRAFCRRY